MKRHLCSLCALLFLCAEALWAQNAAAPYEVAAGSKDNTIVLTVVNESSTGSARGLRVELIREPESILFDSRVQSMEQLGPGEESDCTFRFDVKRNAVAQATDTLQFLVTDKDLNLSWRKTVVLRYAAPDEFRLLQNYPNPFNPTTTIAFDLPDDARVRITVYDMLGREVRLLLDEERKAGCYDVAFNADGIASGVYFYRMTAEPGGGSKPFAQVKKLMLLR